MGEVHLCFQRFRYRLVLAELSTVIERDGMADVFVVTQH